jgi:hypothetical protein
MPAEPASAELPEPVADGESATLDDDDSSLPEGAADQAEMAGDDAAGPVDAGDSEDETNDIPPVDDVP